eukprot:Sro482_g151740.1 UPF0187 protein (390) ;mRNA; r:6886-8055
MDVNAGNTRLARNQRTCPTRELYFLHSQWGKHKSPYRKFRHMAYLFQSAPFQRLLFPDLFCVTTVAGLLTYYNEFVATSTATGLSISPTAFAGATTAIGLLAGFRLNNSYGRYNEGRKSWSDTQTTLRDLARQTVMWVPENDDMKTRMLRLCQAFPVAFLFHLNDKGCHYSMKRMSRLGDKQFYGRVQAEFEAELADVFFYSPPGGSDDKNDKTTVANNATTPPILQEDFDRICQVKANGGNVPLEIITCMGETLTAVSSVKGNPEALHPVFVRALDSTIERLTKALGSGERIAKTPLPTGFTRHSSRMLFVWSNSLPFALYPLLGPMGTIPTTLLTSYAVLGIEDISVQLEEPFDVLPLRQFSNTMYHSIQAIEAGFTPRPRSWPSSD